MQVDSPGKNGAAPGEPVLSMLVCPLDADLQIDSLLFFQPHCDGSHGTDGCVVWGRRKIPFCPFSRGSVATPSLAALQE